VTGPPMMLNDPSTPAPPATDHRPAGTPLSVLVVEDNFINRQVAVGMLKALGCRADVATDGRRGAQMAASGRYDLVLMDLQMPLMDGFEASRQIRDSGTAAHVRVVALTANATVDDRERCVAAGMDGFLTKPIRREELARVVAGGGRLAPAEPPAPTSPAPPAPAASAGSVRVLDHVLDREGVLERVGGDPETLVELVGIFTKDSARLLERAVRAVSRRDMGEVRREAHTLKGAVGTVGGIAGFDAWKALEDAAKASDQVGVEKSLAIAIAATERLREALARFASEHSRAAAGGQS